MCDVIQLNNDDHVVNKFLRRVGINELLSPGITKLKELSQLCIDNGSSPIGLTLYSRIKIVDDEIVITQSICN